MEAFGWTVVLEFVFIVTAMAYVGTAVTTRAALEALTDRRLMARALLANIVLMPALGALLLVLIPMPADAAVAVLLLAIAPGGLQAVQFTTKVPGELHVAAALMLVLTVLALVVTPLVALWAPLPRAPSGLAFFEVVAAALLALVLPLALGHWVVARAPGAAARMARPLLVVSMLAFVAAVLVSGRLKSEASAMLDAPVLLALVVLLAGGLLIGWWVGGPNPRRRRILATATSIRNAGICLLIALTMFPRTAVDAVVLSYMLVMLPPNMVITVWGLVSERRRRG